MARVAALAHELGSPIVELTVRDDNPAQQFYLSTGFARCRNVSRLFCLGRRWWRSRKTARKI